MVEHIHIDYLELVNYLTIHRDVKTEQLTIKRDKKKVIGCFINILTSKAFSYIWCQEVDSYKYKCDKCAMDER